jgi:hypothetical protein
MLPVREQLAEAKMRIRRKIPRGEVGYIAYFQAFTNTYGSVEVLESKFREALEDSEVRVLSIATRPDCLPDDMLDMISRLNEIKPVWIELGLQTVQEITAEYIRRGYRLEVYDKAVQELKQRGIDVITHVILGLPGESVKDMLATVDYVGRTGTQGVKLQLLHILQGTDLEKPYKEGKIHVMSLQEYIDLLELCVRHLPEDMVIHRLTGDGPKWLLLAPDWSANKKLVLNTIQKEFTRRDVIQGSLMNGTVIRRHCDQEWRLYLLLAVAGTLHRQSPPSDCSMESQLHIEYGQHHVFE